MTRYTLHKGDCLDVLPSIPSRSVDLIVSDIPYGTTQNKWDSILPLDRLWKQIWRVAKMNAAVVLTAQTPFDKVLGVSCIEHLKYEWIWDKVAASGHLNAKKQPMKAHENVLFFYRESPIYNPQMVDGPLRKATQGRRGSSNYGTQKLGATYESSKRFPRSIITIPKDANRHGKLHPTQKPVELMEYMIHTYTKRGAVVLDFCMGSGSTGVAALGLNRRFIGIEKDKDIFELAQNRIKESDFE